MKKWFVPHPFAMAVFPVLFLFAQNARQMSVTEIFLPMLAVLVLALVIYLPLLFITRQPNKSALISFITLAFIFTFGQLTALLEQFETGLRMFDRHHEGVIFWFVGLPLLVLVIFIYRSRKTFDRLTYVLNRLIPLMVLLQIIIGGYTIATRPSAHFFSIENSNDENSGPIEINNPPNIFYIVLDGYARGDIVKEVFDVDNSEFISFLRSKGFYVADSAHSNYAQTLQSLSSTLNMDYLDKLITVSPSVDDRVLLVRLLRKNRLMEFLSRSGYQTVGFATGYNYTEPVFCDLKLEPKGNFGEFVDLLVKTTPLPYFQTVLGSPFDRDRNRILYTLSKLSELDEVSEPFIAWAHVIAPHPPFLFDDKGNDYERTWLHNHSDGSDFVKDGGTKEEYLRGYRNQVKYITGRVQETVTEILDRYQENPPIIIIQGDHGSGYMLDWNSSEKTNMRERFSILNAYYLPGVDTSLLYPSITPINTFRLICRDYFGRNLPPLSDDSYFSIWKFPYAYELVNDRIRNLDSLSTAQ